MKEQLIEFETAKLAKEKGFDVNTYSKCWVKLLDGKIIHNSEIRNIFEHDRCEQYLMQPTQSLLQKWLREKHRFYVWVDTVYHDGFNHSIHAEYFLNDFSKTNPDWMDKVNNHELDSYETVLEKGLIEALKLIKTKNS